MPTHHILLLWLIQSFDVYIVAEINLMSAHFTKVESSINNWMGWNPNHGSPQRKKWVWKQEGSDEEQQVGEMTEAARSSVSWNRQLPSKDAFCRLSEGWRTRQWDSFSPLAAQWIWCSSAHPLLANTVAKPDSSFCFYFWLVLLLFWSSAAKKVRTFASSGIIFFHYFFSYWE